MYPFFFIILFLFAALSFADEPQLPEEQKSEADKRADLLGTVQVSRVHSLDEVKGSYKSPRRAMFMSLLVPGSGQFYVGGQPRYIRGAFYLAEEIALITGLYYHSIYKYDKQVKKYRNHADKYFIIGKYEEAMKGITILDQENADAFQLHYGSGRDDYCTAIYGKAAGGSDSKCVLFASGYDFYKSYEQAGMSFKPSTFPNPSTFYRAIANESFILGWEGTVINPIAETEINSGKHVQLIEGESEHYNKYISMRKKATDLADRQAIFFGAIILNHIVSAIDAALSAKAHNNSLYEEKVSFLDKFRLGSNFSAGENFKAEAAVIYLF